MKTMTLVSSAIHRPDPSTSKMMEEADQYPRATLFSDVLNTKLIDGRDTDDGTMWNRVLGSLSAELPQIAQAFGLRNQYDAIISWNERFAIPLAFLLKISRSRVPHVAICSWISQPKKAIPLRWLNSHLDRIILMSSNQFQFAIDAIGLSSSKVVLLKWPVDQKFWRPIPGPNDMICTVGREMRDFGTFIEAMKGMTIRCHIAVGAVPGKTDPWQQQLKEAGSLESHITVGRKSYLELRDLYAASRFVVVPLLPTDTDNGTTTILEAMAMAKAVICTRVEGQKDVIRDGVTGIFVPPQDPRALREAIEYLWNNPAIAERMGAEGRKVIEQHHSLDTWVTQVRSIVEQSVREKRAA